MDKNELEGLVDELRKTKLKEVAETFDIVFDIVGPFDGNRGSFAAAKKSLPKEPKKELVT